jgi:hypothetical protein
MRLRRPLALALLNAVVALVISGTAVIEPFVPTSLRPVPIIVAYGPHIGEPLAGSLASSPNSVRAPPPA